MESWTLYYDGGCELCHQSQLCVERWVRDSGQEIKVELLSSERARSKGYGEQMILEADGKILKAGEAFLFLIRRSPWYFKWVEVICRIQPFRAFALAIYGVVARNRTKWFGRRSCPIHSERS